MMIEMKNFMENVMNVSVEMWMSAAVTTEVRLQQPSQTGICKLSQASAVTTP